MLFGHEAPLGHPAAGIELVEFFSILAPVIASMVALYVPRVMDRKARKRERDKVKLKRQSIGVLLMIESEEIEYDARSYADSLQELHSTRSWRLNDAVIPSPPTLCSVESWVDALTPQQARAVSVLNSRLRKYQLLHASYSGDREIMVDQEQILELQTAALNVAEAAARVASAIHRTLLPDHEIEAMI